VLAAAGEGAGEHCGFGFSDGYGEMGLEWWVWNSEMEEFNCVRIIIGAEGWGSMISSRVKLRRGARNFVIA